MPRFVSVKLTVTVSPGSMALLAGKQLSATSEAPATLIMGTSPGSAPDTPVMPVLRGSSQSRKRSAGELPLALAPVGEGAAGREMLSSALYAAETTALSM